MGMSGACKLAGQVGCGPTQDAGSCLHAYLPQPACPSAPPATRPHRPPRARTPSPSTPCLSLRSGVGGAQHARLDHQVLQGGCCLGEGRRWVGLGWISCVAVLGPPLHPCRAASRPVRRAALNCAAAFAPPPDAQTAPRRPPLPIPPPAPAPVKTGSGHLHCRGGQAVLCQRPVAPQGVCVGR